MYTNVLHLFNIYMNASKRFIKSAVFQMLKELKMKKIKVNTGQVMFNEEIYYY